MESPTPQPTLERLKLSQAAEYLLDECRMVLPGIQALFGFQLIAVFNNRFGAELAPVDQRVHYAALALVAIAAGLVMTPAAFHRQTRPHEVSDSFLNLASRLLLLSMIPLEIGISLDFYVIGNLIFHSRLIGAIGAAALLAAFSLLWFVFPRLFPKETPEPRS